MIKPEELRIGNILATKLNESGWVKIDINHLVSIAQGNQYGYEPIPLTPEILEQSGFEKSNDPYGGWLSPEYHDERFRVVRDEISFCWLKGGGNPIRLPYLHSLQNWYYTFTGTELDFKSKTIQQ